VSLLEPIGNITAETSSAVHNMRVLKQGSDEGSAQYLLAIVAVATFVFIAVAVEHPIVNGWDILGLAVPFYIATATYAVFAWLDSNASDEATQVISSWLHGRSHNKPDLGNLIINAFDRVYTSPLLSFRAFRRSVAISSIIAIMVSSIVGLSVVLASFSTFLALSVIAAHWLVPAFAKNLPVTIADFFNLFEFALLTPWFVEIMRPAFIIHLWLPLFALSSVIARLVFWIFRAVEWAQWFLKQGDAHPLKAIGVVATIIVFGSAMLVKEGWALLSVLERS
jgi:hypothetical protein